MRGVKEEYKKVIINECISLCACKWYNLTTFKQKGIKVHLQPNAFHSYMKALFSVFKEQGILFQFDKDFNGDHQFHAILKSTWREGKS